MKELSVSAIKDGIVIDHIPPEYTFKILDLLDVEQGLVTLGNNLKSDTKGRKGLIKISEKRLSKQDLNKIAILTPEATINVIRNFKVIEKFKVSIPDVFVNSLRCFNPNCITRHEEVTTKFKVINKDPLKIKCHYCEKIGGKDSITLLK